MHIMFLCIIRVNAVISHYILVFIYCGAQRSIFSFCKKYFCLTICMQCMYVTEKSNIMVFEKKNSNKKGSLINQAVDLDFLVRNSTVLSDALVRFISDKILKQIPLLMSPQAKYHVLNLPETNKDSLELFEPQPGSHWTLRASREVQMVERLLGMSKLQVTLGC